MGVLAAGCSVQKPKWAGTYYGLLVAHQYCSDLTASRLEGRAEWRVSQVREQLSIEGQGTFGCSSLGATVDQPNHSVVARRRCASIPFPPDNIVLGQVTLKQGSLSLVKDGLDVQLQIDHEVEDRYGGATCQGYVNGHLVRR